MTTYVLRDGELIEKSKAPPKGGVFVMSDVQPFISPIDKSEISSRSQIREHERKHGVYQIGNDWCGRQKPAFWDSLKKG